MVWDKFHVYQGHRVNTPYIQIGVKPGDRSRIGLDTHRNALKQALHFQDVLDSGQADSQEDLSRRCGIPRTTISAYLRLLRLDPQVQACLLQLDDSDPRLQRLTEPRLRPLHGQDAQVQRQCLQELLCGFTVAGRDLMDPRDPPRPVQGPGSTHGLVDCRSPEEQPNCVNGSMRSASPPERSQGRFS